MTEILKLALGDRAYPIHFSANLATLQATIGDLRAEGRAVRVFSDANLLKALPDYLTQAGFKAEEILTLPAGEPTKSVAVFSQALSFLAQSNASRETALFAFGGGVIGDLTGYVAASYLRGIDFYQIPTSLLAMVDSSVGGKTGINLPEGKNLVGAFWQPKAVFINAATLQTLPPREFSAGMAEVIKYGMLADLELFEKLEKMGVLKAEASELPSIIRKCCELKATIVADDETETAQSGGRALLNLGHTFAHAIENVAGYGEYLHGEAVAIGLKLATQLSVELGQIESEWILRVEQLLNAYQLPTALKSSLLIADLLTAMGRDKKNRNGQLRFVTMQAVGQAITSENVSTDLINDLWKSAGAN
jgi:3-dehydroquinate synthase